MNIQIFPFDFQGCTVDGSEILCHQLRLVLYRIIYRVLYIVVGLISSIKSIGKKKGCAFATQFDPSNLCKVRSLAGFGQKCSRKFTLFGGL